MSDSFTALRAHVQSFPSALLGYSGGVDSALLAVVLRQEVGRERMLAVIGRSASYPEVQWQVGREPAVRLDIPLAEVTTHERQDANQFPNAPNPRLHRK